MDFAEGLLGGAGMVGDWIFGGQSQKDAQNFSAREAAKQRQWAGVMAGSQHQWNMDAAERARGWQKTTMQNQKQWQVEDLKKAGLNPMLAVGQGVAAPSAPQGSTGAGPGGSAASSRSNVSMSGSAAEAARYFREIKATNSQIKLNEKLGEQAKSTANKAAAEASISKAELKAIAEESRLRASRAKFNRKPNVMGYDLMMDKLMRWNPLRFGGKK